MFELYRPLIFRRISIIMSEQHVIYSQIFTWFWRKSHGLDSDFEVFFTSSNFLVGPVVRICRSHRQGPGSIPGLGILLLLLLPRPRLPGFRTCHRGLSRHEGISFFCPRSINWAINTSKTLYYQSLPCVSEVMGEVGTIYNAMAAIELQRDGSVEWLEWTE